MLFNDLPERYFVYAHVEGRGWQLRHGNLSDAAGASAFAQSLSDRGIPVRIERRLTDDVSDALHPAPNEGALGKVSAAASIDWWVKVVGMLEQNWAVLSDAAGWAEIRFLDDGGRVFDELSQPARRNAERALSRNGFKRFSESPELQQFLHPPIPPFRPGTHPNGRIYSSGRFWK